MCMCMRVPCCLCVWGYCPNKVVICSKNGMDGKLLGNLLSASSHQGHPTSFLFPSRTLSCIFCLVPVHPLFVVPSPPGGEWSVFFLNTFPLKWICEVTADWKLTRWWGRMLIYLFVQPEFWRFLATQPTGHKQNKKRNKTSEK